jgi:hypothetical protein
MVVREIRLTNQFLIYHGTAGTLNSDQARDFDLALKERFYLQPLPPAEAAARAKSSAQDILNLKPLIDKKAWPYVMNDLRLRASYLRYDLNTVIASKPREEKKSLKELTGKLFSTIDSVSHAAIESRTIAQFSLSLLVYITCAHFGSLTMRQRSRAPQRLRNTTRRPNLRSMMFSPS